MDGKMDGAGGERREALHEEELTFQKEKTLFDDPS